MENTVFCCQECVFIGPLPSNGCPVVEHVCSVNVFIESVPSNGHLRHNIQGLDKILEHCRYCTHFIINMVLDHLLPAIQPQSLLECTRASFNSLAECSSWRTFSCCFRDVGDGNLFLTLFSKTDQSGSIMFKSGNYAGQGSCWSSPSCSSNHDWTVPAVWMGSLSSYKTESLFGNNVWIMGCTWLHNLSKHFLAVIRPWRVIVGATDYNILLPKPWQNLPHVSLLEPSIANCRLPWVFSKRTLFLMQGTAWRTAHLTISRARFRLSNVQVL
jgi:hypothetical protein